MTRTCSNCGQPTDVNAKWCPNCGAELPVAVLEGAESPEERDTPRSPENISEPPTEQPAESTQQPEQPAESAQQPEQPAESAQQLDDDTAPPRAAEVWPPPPRIAQYVPRSSQIKKLTGDSISDFVLAYVVIALLLALYGVGIIAGLAALVFMREYKYVVNGTIAVFVTIALLIGGALVICLFAGGCGSWLHL